MTSKQKGTSDTIFHLMNKIVEFLREGSVTLKTIESPINGTLEVKWDTYAGYQIMGGGLWQVGGPVETVWKESLSKLQKADLQFGRVLILGLGGGTAARIIRKHWKTSHITGVDIDPVIVELGKQYLGLNKLRVHEVIGDAYAFIEKTPTTKYDLICVDTYVGEEFPQKFNSDAFIKNLKKAVSKNGMVLINRLYDGPNRKIAEAYFKRLKTVFPHVVEVFPEANVVYLCSLLPISLLSEEHKTNNNK